MRPQTQGIRNATVSSLNEMLEWLTSWMGSTSPAVKEALLSQSNVISYVQSPILIDKTFDSLLVSLDKSIQKARSQKEQACIRSMFSRMVRDYVFVLEAKYHTIDEQDRDVSHDLFIQAGDMLANSLKGIAQLVEGNGTNNVNTVIVNPFAEESESSFARFFIKLSKQYRDREDELDEQEDLFYQSLESIIKRLGEEKNKQLFGKTNLISETLKHCISCLQEYRVTQEKIAHNSWETAYKMVIVGVIIIMVSLFFVAPVRAFFSFGGLPHGWFLRQMLWSVLIAIGLVLIGILLSLPSELEWKRKMKELLQSFQSLEDMSDSYAETEQNPSFDLKEEIPTDNSLGISVVTNLDNPEKEVNNIEAVDSSTKNTETEEEYREEVKSILEDGVIGTKERVYLERVRIRLGITEERAKEIEAL